jgi:uncharacterized CHY-type Zn-finger protein
VTVHDDDMERNTDTVGEQRTVGGATVRGLELDPETRCAHYGSESDVVAIRFHCCPAYYACYRCHRTLADHDARTWPRSAFDEPAVLCGACGARLAVEQYVGADDACPECDAPFNPGCADHYHRYFDVDGPGD